MDDGCDRKRVKERGRVDETVDSSVPGNGFHMVGALGVMHRRGEGVVRKDVHAGCRQTCGTFAKSLKVSRKKLRNKKDHLGSLKTSKALALTGPPV